MKITIAFWAGLVIGVWFCLILHVGTAHAATNDQAAAIKQQLIAVLVQEIAFLEQELAQLQAAQGVGQVVTPLPATTTASAPITQVPAPTCSFGATAALWPQGTTHALFSWSIPDGTEGQIENADGSPASLFYEASMPGTFFMTNSHAQHVLYGPSIFSTTTYQLVVTNGSQQSECSATVTP